MRLDRRLVWAMGVMAAASIVWLLVTMGLLVMALAADQRALVLGQLAPQLWLIGLTWLMGLVVIAATLRWLFRRYASAPARLLEQTRVLLAAEQAAPMQHQGTHETQELAQVVFQLASQRDQLRREMASQVAQASLGIQQEKDRLAALMAELTQSVVVCNLDGRILLYNNRARLQFRTLSNVPALAGGAELVGIGRSIYAVFDRALVAHAIDSIQQRLLRGAANPSAQFVTSTAAGQLLKVQMAPVRTSNTEDANNALSGFVLMLDNVTRAFEEEKRRDQMLHTLTQGCRASLAGMKTALATLEASELTGEPRARQRQILHDEMNSMAQRITDLDKQASHGQSTRWPLEEMLGADVLLVAQQRIQKHCQRTVSLEQLDDSLWLRVDSYSLIQALVYLSARLVDEFDVRFLRLRLLSENGVAKLDLIWTDQVMSTETVMIWQMDSMQMGAESTRLSVRDVVERHGGELIFARERVRHEAFFRFALPQVNVQDLPETATLGHGDSRPEYYDFDLFQSTDQTSALDDRRLNELAYTVFDTETTGLNPSEGDEIIQIGATRCVNGKLLRQESFEQLVNPGRLIPAATIPIHGITQEMVRGQPRITEVLPAFHRFASDTVLVAHNAAFDMKFLQLQEAATGLKFDQPVLDTLLLSAVVHANHEEHRLEVLAERFNITVLGRHTALGDALVTAEVWLRLIPLLQAMGITTLRQAREAAQKTYYARLRY
ncbi:3'-5' exonuclease [Rhodoferax fermentans]|uniref:DNA-directed DNA polymerase n=1 Tax=Rhodoferax fermentans TaxID=28066 RepID=A0A1T1AQV4_RHOFE|nr:3'-5' exonuclease [Rhodoferax fermentans]MBK1684630.1 3'-5' exonuclease [Rhodoferax fermentans]OOV06489.1 DNA polymerase III subunit epsilon [Rhodoferax fermentans]